MQSVLARVVGLLALVAAPALAQDPAAGSSYDQAFVDAFAEACVPGRLSYAASLDAAGAAGWSAVDRSDHPELTTIMQRSDEALADSDIDSTYETTLFARDVAGSRHHLAISNSSFVIEAGDDPWVMVGCHLYNFEATAPVDPAPVTALIGNPISASHEQDGAVSHVWGPPCPMPRTGDTYLTFLAEGSPMAAQAGFTGAALNFSTSTPDEGEEVPDSYC